MPGGYRGMPKTLQEYEKGCPKRWDAEKAVTPPFEALEPGNDIGVNDVLRRPTVSYCFKVKPENGSTVVIVCLFPV